MRPNGGIGRHARLKIWCQLRRVGSSPTSATIYEGAYPSRLISGALNLGNWCMRVQVPSPLPFQKEENMDPNKENNKSWKKTGNYGTYEEALVKKQEFISEDPNYVVKIRRCGPRGSRFTIKRWHPDYNKPKSNKKNKRSDSSAG